MGRLSLETRSQIITLFDAGMKIPLIHEEERIAVNIR